MGRAHLLLAALALALASATLACRTRAWTAAPAAAAERAPAAERMNVLLVLVDDLRPVLGCYGDEQARTPHMDALAAGGVLFRRAYADMAVCAPSRASILTGLRIDTHGVADLRTHYRESVPDVVALPELFLRAGYTALALGKVHHGHGALDDPRAWSCPPYRPDGWTQHHVDPASVARIEAIRAEALARGFELELRRTMYFAVDPSDVGDEELLDGRLATRAIELLEELREEPFFLAVGFVRPHVPWVAPRRYFEQFPEGALRPAPPRALPEGAPPFVGDDSRELRGLWDVPQEGPIGTPEREAELVRGYYAATSFVDAQVGRVLAALERLELDQRTVVVLASDHGFHLGDLGLWGKKTNYESAVRSPLIVRAPHRGVRGAASDGLVELLDIYPTLAELCGLEPPAGLEGTSFVPLLDDPARAWKRAVYHRYPSGDGEGNELMGSAVRDATHRLVVWKGAGPFDGTRELYDYSGPGEQRNVAGDPEQAEHEARLLRLLEGGWRAALPP